MLLLDISCQLLGTNVSLLVYVRGVGICRFSEINISKEYSQLTVWDIFDSWTYMLVLDISCQFLGDEYKFDSFCAPFGRGYGKCTF